MEFRRAIFAVRLVPFKVPHHLSAVTVADVDDGVQRRAPSVELPDPVWDHRKRHDNQERSGNLLSLEKIRQQAGTLDRFSQPQLLRSSPVTNIDVQLASIKMGTQDF